VVFFVPIYFAWFQENYTIFDLNKSVALHCLLTITIISWLIQVSLEGKFQWQGNKLFCILGTAVAVVFFLSTVFSLHPVISLWGSYERQQGLYNLWHYLAVTFFIVVAIKNREQIHSLIIALLLGSVFASTYGLLQLFGLDFYTWGEDIGRLFSSFGQPNFFGHYLAVLLPLTLYAIFFLSKNIYTRIGYSVLLIAEVLCLIFTFSRSAWLALLITVIGCFLWILLRNGKKIFFGVFISLIIASTAMVSFPAIREKIAEVAWQQDVQAAQRFLSIFDLNSGTTRTRLLYWEAAVNGFKDATLKQKIVGYGPDALPNVFVQYYQPEWAYFEKMNSFPDRAHNFILDILLQFGLLGFISLTFFVGYIVIRLTKVTWKEQNTQNYWLGVSVLSALCIYAINNLFSFSLVSMNVVFYTLLGIAWLIGNNYTSSTFSLDFFQPISRWVLTGVISIFLITLLYGYNFRPLMADYYFFKVKKAETRGDCQTVIANMEKTINWYPVSHFYSRAFISYGVSCFATYSSKKEQQYVAEILLDQANNIDSKEKQYYTLVDLSRLYSILSSFIDQKYYDNAKESYEELLSINPWITFVYSDYGRFELWHKNYDQAITIFTKGIDAMPSIEPQEAQFRRNDIVIELSNLYTQIGVTLNNQKKFAP
jgi:O-antigen ligase